MARPRRSKGSKPQKLWSSAGNSVKGPKGVGGSMTKRQRFGPFRSDYAINIMQHHGISREDYAKLSVEERSALHNRTPTGRDYMKEYNSRPEVRADQKIHASRHLEKRGLRTPRWIRDNSYPPANQRIKDIYRLAGKGGKAVDHGLPLMGKHVSGLDVPDNLTPMNQRANMSKGNRLPDDFLDWHWKHDTPLPGSRMGKKGRLSAWRVSPEGIPTRVPRSQGGFINAGLLKGIGKVGALGAAEMALNYLAPNNPVNQARDYGYNSLKNMGLDIEGGIRNIENPMLRGSAHLANGLLADPLITAFGAGNWAGNRIQEELRGEHATNRLERTGSGLQGRFKTGLLDG